MTLNHYLKKSMELDNISDLVSFFRDRNLRSRIGIWRLPLVLSGQEKNIAVKLGIEAVDFCIPYREKIPEGATFLGLTCTKILEVIDTIASQSGFSDCVLVYNLDFFLAGIKQKDRQNFWQETYKGFPHRKRALILAIPETAIYTYPSRTELERWRQAKKLV